MWEVVIVKNVWKIVSCVFTLAVLMVSAAVAVTPIEKGANPNLKPTFHRGFSVGLRPAPTQCQFVTPFVIPFSTKDYARAVKDECEKTNPRKKFCVEYCVNKAERERRKALTLSLKAVPNAPCANPPKRVYPTPEDCTKERLRHCSVNCKRGTEQSQCSNEAFSYCRRQGKTPFVPYVNVAK